VTELEVSQTAPVAVWPSTETRITPQQAIARVQKARSGRALTDLQRQFTGLGLLDDPTNAAIQERRKEVQRLLTKSRKVAWLWANIYGYGDDDLVPVPVYDPQAAFLAVVQAGVILVLNDERRRIACFVSDDGRIWKRYRIRRNTPLNTNAFYSCRIRRFPRTHR